MVACKPSTRLRLALASGKTIFRPGVALAVQAQMAEALGFEAVGASTGNLASHIYGLPDVGLITLTEVVNNVRAIAGSVDIPVIADCDTGFGNAIGVRRTVREMIGTGAAGIFFEDQVSPKRCGSVKGSRILPLEEAVGKFRSAVEVRDRTDPDFVIIARTDARGAIGGGVDEAIRRAQAYEAAGVDIVHVEALQSREEIRELRAAVKGYFTCSANSLQLSLEEMQELGVCITMGTMFFKAGLVAEWDLLVAMKERGLAPYHEFVERARTHPMGGPGVQQLVGMNEVVELERRFLPDSEQRDYDAAEGVYDPRKEHSVRLRRKHPSL